MARFSPPGLQAAPGADFQHTLPESASSCAMPGCRKPEPPRPAAPCSGWNRVAPEPFDW